MLDQTYASEVTKFRDRIAKMHMKLKFQISEIGKLKLKIQIKFACFNNRTQV